MDKTLAAGDLELFRKDFAASPSYRLAQNAVTRVTVDDVSINRDVVNNTDHSLSILLDDWKVTDQQRSGRCWLFAGLNLLRVGAMKKMGLKEFEFSQNYAMFWDKIERANYFLEAVIETADRDVDDRTVAHLLEAAAEDGGQWNMFVAIVNKHGLVPKAFMPETQSSGDTGRMNSVLRSQLRQGAKAVRDAFSRDGVEAARQEKGEILKIIYRVLAIHLGTPPERFDWQWTDKERQFHRDGVLTPRVRVGVRGPAHRRLCLPGTRPTPVQPGRQDLHGAVPGQRPRRAARDLPERRGSPHERRRGPRDAERRACLVRL